jgi:hypothetical protein
MTKFGTSHLRRRAARAAVALALFAAASAQADVTISEEARTHFQAGVNLLKDPDGARYEEAYREFKAAYAASPSYKILGNLGLCAMKLERDGEAIEAYGQYLQHGAELDPAEVKQVSTDLQTLKTGAVKVALKVEPAGATLNDVRVPVRGERIVNQYGPIAGAFAVGIRPGHHIMTVRLEGHEDAVWELDAAAGGSVSKAFTLKKSGAAVASSVSTTGAAGTADVRPGGRSSAGLYVGLVATGAFAIGATVTGIMALGKKRDFDAKNDGRDPSGARDLADQGKKLNLVTDVLIGGAVVSGAITSYFLFSRPSSASSASASAGVLVGDGGGGVVVNGRF